MQLSWFGLFALWAVFSLCEAQDDLLSHARQLRLQGDFRRAKQILRDSFEARKDDYSFLTLYGRLLVDSREIYPGLSHCREVDSSISPPLPLLTCPSTQAIELIQRSGHSDACILAPARYCVGLAYDMQQRPETAIESYEKAVQCPSDLESFLSAVLRMSRIYFDKEEYNHGLRLFSGYMLHLTGLQRGPPAVMSIPHSDEILFDLAHLQTTLLIANGNLTAATELLASFLGMVDSCTAEESIVTFSGLSWPLRHCPPALPERLPVLLHYLLAAGSSGEEDSYRQELQGILQRQPVTAVTLILQLLGTAEVPQSSLQRLESLLQSEEASGKLSESPNKAYLKRSLLLSLYLRAGDPSAALRWAALLSPTVAAAIAASGQPYTAIRRPLSPPQCLPAILSTPALVGNFLQSPLRAETLLQLTELCASLGLWEAASVALEEYSTLPVAYRGPCWDGHSEQLATDVSTALQAKAAALPDSPAVIETALATAEAGEGEEQRGEGSDVSPSHGSSQREEGKESAATEESCTVAVENRDEPLASSTSLEELEISDEPQLSSVEVTEVTEEVIGQDESLTETLESGGDSPSAIGSDREPQAATEGSPTEVQTELPILPATDSPVSDIEAVVHSPPVILETSTAEGSPPGEPIAIDSQAAIPAMEESIQPSDSVQDAPIPTGSPPSSDSSDSAVPSSHRVTPSASPATLESIQAILKVVHKHIEASQYPQALKHLNSAIYRDPDSSELLELRAATLLRSNRQDRFIRAAEDLVAIVTRLDRGNSTLLAEAYGLVASLPRERRLAVLSELYRVTRCADKEEGGECDSEVEEAIRGEYLIELIQEGQPVAKEVLMRKYKPLLAELQLGEGREERPLSAGQAMELLQLVSFLQQSGPEEELEMKIAIYRQLYRQSLVSPMEFLELLVAGERWVEEWSVLRALAIDPKDLSNADRGFVHFRVGCNFLSRGEEISAAAHLNRAMSLGHYDLPLRRLMAYNVSLLGEPSEGSIAKQSVVLSPSRWVANHHKNLSIQQRMAELAQGHPGLLQRHILTHPIPPVDEFIRNITATITHQQI